jgi:hypothetical protein
MIDDDDPQATTSNHLNHLSRREYEEKHIATRIRVWAVNQSMESISAFGFRLSPPWFVVRSLVLNLRSGMSDLNYTLDE